MMKRNKGITLIALIITIIIMLILVGVSIRVVINSNIIGIAEETGELAKNKQEEEANIELEDFTGKTMARVYNDDMIGNATVNYETATALPEDVEWIVIGKNEEGILATTSRPLGIVDSETAYLFQLIGTPANWLSYKTDLNAKCAELFAGEIQGKEVKIESININHINTLLGFEEPTLNEYTFSNYATNNYANKQVYYYHPDATSDNKWSQNEAKYYCNAYEYYESTDGVYIKYEGNGWSATKHSENMLKNSELILGSSENQYSYAIATTATKIFSEYVLFSAGEVHDGKVETAENHMCLAEQNRVGENYGTNKTMAVRPVIVIPNNAKIESVDNDSIILAE